MRRYSICTRVLLVLTAITASCTVVGQRYVSEPRYDSLNTRHDPSRPPLERYWLTSNHRWASWNMGLKQEARQAAKEELEIAEQLGVDSLLANAYDDLSGSFIGSSESALQLKYSQKALEHAIASGSRDYTGTVQKGFATVYKPLGDYPRALDYLRKALTNLRRPSQINRACCHMSDCFRLMGQADSALYWAQRSNIVTDPAQDTYGYARSYYVLGAAYAAKGERELAEVHFKRCIEVADSFDVMVPLYGALVARGRMKLEAENVEGAIADGRRGLHVSQNGDDLSGMIESTELLSAAFERDGLLDSAFHYFKLKAVCEDSLRSVTNLNKLQNMAFEQELRERDEAKAKAEAAAARSRNIQFGIIALIVITLGIFLLIFSRTAVVGAKAIKNLSLIALLLFFEFINLLLHPFLGELTHHSPILMLLCMAAIAGLLIPLHHRMEKLITNMLVSKNNRVRLEAARRTIEELEGAGKDAQ